MMTLKPTLSPKGFLGTMDIFKGIPATALQEVERRVMERKFVKNESIFLEGDPAEFVWFVKEGYVKAAVHAPNGRCQTLCMVGPHSMFGSCCSLGGGTYSCNSVAETEVTVVALPMSDFFSFMEKYPSLSRAIVGHISTRLRHAKGMQTFDQESVEKRILHVLAD